MTNENDQVRYDRLDPAVIHVFQLAELADQGRKDDHLGSHLKFCSDTAMNIFMALDCEDNMPPLTQANILTCLDAREPDISTNVANARAS